MVSPNFKVSVIHSDVIAMFYSLDHHMFLSSQILQAAQMDEPSLALLIAHELSHFLLLKLCIVSCVFNGQKRLSIKCRPNILRIQKEETQTKVFLFLPSVTPHQQVL